MVTDNLVNRCEDKIWEKIETLKQIDPKNAKELISNRKRGIYFWFDKKTDELVYIGRALGVRGLRGRIVSQHLRETYIEYRAKKQSKTRDAYQLAHPYINGEKRGIDKSAFRKSIGRMKCLKPGKETLNYILDNLYLRIWEEESKEKGKKLEKYLIKKCSPKFNTQFKALKTKQYSCRHKGIS